MIRLNYGNKTNTINVYNTVWLVCQENNKKKLTEIKGLHKKLMSTVQHSVMQHGTHTSSDNIYSVKKRCKPTATTLLNHRQTRYERNPLKLHGGFFIGY